MSEIERPANAKVKMLVVKSRRKLYQNFLWDRELQRDAIIWQSQTSVKTVLDLRLPMSSALH